MSGLPVVELDGKPCDAHMALDRGLQYGDGLFETMVVRAGRIRFLAQHQARLAEGCRRLGMRLDADALWRRVAAFAAGGQDALVKLLVTRGEARQRGYAFDGTETPRVILYRHALVAPPAEPASAVRLGMPLGENPLLAGLKHCNRLELVLAATELRGRRATEGLLASSSGALISGTMSNVFLSMGGKWMTPRVDRCGVAGVMRAVVMREAARAGQPVREAELPFAALDDCEALCVGNVRLGLVPVTDLDGRALAVPAWASSLQQRIAALDE